ncbi:MAG TPA: pre-peptidase C-terminal domain-containing protein [Aggregatilineaceae bacterium]|nr:pre-peptidase C-terminal domain-containing protein [Aggregatilineaceae bacterium]
MRSQRRLFQLGLVLCVLTGVGRAGAAFLLQQSSRIHYDETVRGQLTDTSTGQDWTFTGHSGDLVLIDMQASGSSTLDPYLTLQDSDGNSLVSDDDGGEGVNARIGPYPLPADGEYTINATSYTGTGEYALELKNLNTIPTLVPGKPLVGVVSMAHPSDYFLLATAQADSDTLVRLHISADDPNASPYLSVYGPSGFIISTETQTDLSTIDPIVLLPSESYAVAVTWNPSGTGGAYELVLDKSSTDLLQEGVVQSGSLTYDTYSQRHYFRGEEGEVVRITVTGEGEIAPAIQVATLDFGSYLFTNEGETTYEVTATITIPTTGVYVVDIHDGSYAGGSGTYTIRLERVKS